MEGPATAIELLVREVPENRREADDVAWAIDSAVRMERDIRALSLFLREEFFCAHRQGEPMVDTAIRLMRQLKRLREIGNGDRVVLAEEHDFLVHRLKGHIARVAERNR